MPDNKSRSPFQRRYPPEMRERAVRLVAETIAEAGGERHGAVTQVARQLGIGTESLRTWLRQAEIDAGQRPGLTSEERERLTQVEVLLDQPFQAQVVGQGGRQQEAGIGHQAIVVEAGLQAIHGVR